VDLTAVTQDITAHE